MIKTTSTVSKNTVNVDDVDFEFQMQHELIQLPQDLMIGESAMRKAGEKYAEKMYEEQDTSFKNRLKRARLSGGYEEVVNHAVGQVFQQDITFTEENDILKEWAEDVDNQGNNITRWGNEAFKSALVDGMCYALVEYSAVETMQDEQGNLLYREGEEWRPKTAEADKSNGWRPYLVHIPTQNILGIRTRSENGREIVTMLRYKEVDDIEDDTDFGRDKIERIRVYREGGFYEVHEKKGEETTFTPKSSGRLSIKEIPLVMCQLGKKITSYTAYPTLQKVADDEMHYWQRSCSYHGNLLEFNDKPVYLATGISNGIPFEQNQKTGEFEQKQLFLYAGMFIQTNQVGATFESKGVDGTSVVNSRQSLVDLENQIMSHKSKLLESPNVQKTATESVLDSKESNSKLKSWALSFEDFMNHILYYLGLWLNEDFADTKIKVNTEFSPQGDMNEVLNAYKSGLISKEKALEELIALGVFVTEINKEEEIQKIANASPNVNSNSAGSLIEKLNQQGQG